MIFKFKYFFVLIIINFFIFLNFLKKKSNSCFLIYHSVANEFDSNDLDYISIKNFSKQCKLLSERYKNKIKSIKNLDINQSIVITFDDGYKTIMTNVFPIIKKYNIPIIVFLCPELFDKDGYLNQDDLIKLQKSGLVDFGIHGYKHKYYGNYSVNIFKYDFEKSIKWFNEKLNIKFPKYFSFPYGSYNNEILDYLHKHELITHIFISKFKTLSLKKNNVSLIPRVSIWNLDNIKTFEQKINGQWDILSYLIKTNEK